MHKQLIKILVAEPYETEWLEFKANYQSPDSIGEYISALSNSACLHGKKHGYLVFGVDDATHEVIGTTYKPHCEKAKGNQGLEPWLISGLDPRCDFKIIEYDYDGKKVVIFKIDAANGRPIRFLKEAFIRVGEHKQPLSKHPEKERKLWNNHNEMSFENGFALENQTSDDILKKIDYPAFFDLLDIPLPDNRDGILNKLEEEKVIRKEDAGYVITNIGGILFAKNLAYFPALERKAVRVIIYNGIDKLNAVKEQVGSKGYAVGFDGLLDWIWDQLPSNELIEGALRQEQKMYPKVAIREFLANTIIHQDFTLSGCSPMVEIYSNRIEITNPGSPIVPTERFIDHAPRSRNEKIAHIMRRMNICEERGSGVDRAINAIELFQLPAPDFQADQDFTRVTLFAHKEFKDMDKKDKVRACYQHCCLRWVLKDFMTNATLRERLQIKDENYPMVSRIIRETINCELIKVSDLDNGSSKFRKYIPFWA